MRFKKVAVGGTFSFFHIGHRHLLKRALEVGEDVVVGVTSDEFASSLGKSHPIEPYEVRALRVLRFCLRKARDRQRIVVFPLDDAGGPASSDPSIEAIIATEETAIRAIEVSLKRVELGLKPAIVEAVEHVLGIDGQPISSTRLWQAYFSAQRNGQVNRLSRMPNSSSFPTHPASPAGNQLPGKRHDDHVPPEHPDREGQ